MPQLADADRRAVLDAAAHLSQCADPERFAVEGAEQLLGLLRAEVAAFTHLDLASRQAQVLITPDVPQYSGPAAGLSCSVVVACHLSARAWRATATYTEVLRRPACAGCPSVRSWRGS